MEKKRLDLRDPKLWVGKEPSQIWAEWKADHRVGFEEIFAPGRRRQVLVVRTQATEPTNKGG